jgi:8-oxo-dGTP pyrophosphatase MutT (NUDIX family)
MRRLFAYITRFLYRLSWPLAGLWLHNSRRVRVMVLAEGRVLLQRSSFGPQRWSLPGGGVEKGESLQLAALREVFEETSIRITESQLELLGERQLRPHGRWPQVQATFFLVRLDALQSPRIQRPMEILAVDWFDLNDIPAKSSSTVAIAHAFYSDLQA